MHRIGGVGTKKLNIENYTYVLDKCCECPGFKALIGFPVEHHLWDFWEENMAQHIKEPIPGVESFRISDGKGIMKFRNNSEITFAVLNLDIFFSRPFHYAEILYGADNPAKWIDELGVIKCEEFPPELELNNELDDFLGSFTINKEEREGKADDK